ncbi:MAG: glycosyltransferase family 2 protein [Bacteroidaceae bacterium]|nr:glycosyltransferase family 2 protein [Bacteroidaceae bacterium]
MKKFAICATIKNENLYLREWVEYHLSIGFNKIILYDNNDEDGEHPDMVIQDYIDSENVVLIKNNYYDERPNQFKQTDAYNDCFQKNKSLYDWIAFIDVDEFIFLENHKKIQYLFDELNYEQADCIAINAIVYADDSLYYNSKPLMERFHTRAKEISFWGSTMNHLAHCIVKTSADIKYIDGNPHFPDIRKCSAMNAECNYFYKDDGYCTYTNCVVDKNIYIKHYYIKSLIEFLYRCKIAPKETRDFKLNQYKEIFEWTEKHEELYQNFLKKNNMNI